MIDIIMCQNLFKKKIKNILSIDVIIPEQVTLSCTNKYPFVCFFSFSFDVS